jgi:serine/threonine-protein kinase
LTGQELKGYPLQLAVVGVCALAAAAGEEMAGNRPSPSSVPPVPSSTEPEHVPTSVEGLPRAFGKYTLVRKLAKGGMAELFVAVQKSVAGFEKLVVIKRILPALNSDRALVDMLLHEARTAATLSHPNIAQIFDVGVADDTYFICMEHVHGEDLRSIVRQMKKKDVLEFPIEHALGIVLGVCAGLAYAHDKRALDGKPLNIVHRDVSPQNVVVTFAGDVKLVDFGIAKSDAMSIDDTKSGRLKGKIPYMSPEQARGETVDRRSDVFSAGVVLFELTTGKRLFKGANEYETIELICEREYPKPSEVRPGYPSELEQIVTRALAKDREQRWDGAREMQAALEEFVRRERISVSAIALSQFMRSLFDHKVEDTGRLLSLHTRTGDSVPADASDAALDSRGAATRTSGTPATSRTVTEVELPSRARTRVIVGLGLLAGLVLAGQWLWWSRHSAVRERTNPPPAAASLLDAGAWPSGASDAGAVVIQGERRR